jgi:hypothetical protein
MRGQVSIEYLIIIGAVVAMAGAIIAFSIGAMDSAQGEGDETVGGVIDFFGGFGETRIGLINGDFSRGLFGWQPLNTGDPLSVIDTAYGKQNVITLKNEDIEDGIGGVKQIILPSNVEPKKVECTALHYGKDQEGFSGIIFSFHDCDLSNSYWVSTKGINSWIEYAIYPSETIRPSENCKIGIALASEEQYVDYIRCKEVETFKSPVCGNGIIEVGDDATGNMKREYCEKINGTWKDDFCPPGKTCNTTTCICE